ncbi:MAG: sigma-70 family RNA polymerase sigma factor [Candidatus Omnitrophica bacterium]|nr:sigma-70 family RNA polymerase sigma factor [Candidatus Omnitrophota bacterium]
MDIVQSDELLVQKARQGNRDAFGVLVRRYQTQAVLVAQSVLKNMELAKDASQNAFAKAYFGLSKFRQDAQFKTWLFRIVFNEATDVYRKEKSRGLFKFWSARETEEGEEESILEVIPSNNRSPREEFEVQEMKERLERAINQLPAREREVFLLRYLNGFEISGVAETLGIAVGTVKAHLAHGTEKLKSILLVPAKLRSEGRNIQGGD